MTKDLYYGPHLHAALKCLNAGYPKNATSWMERDLGELDNKLSYNKIDPDSLEVDKFGILFNTYAENLMCLNGDAI